MERRISLQTASAILKCDCPGPSRPSRPFQNFQRTQVAMSMRLDTRRLTHGFPGEMTLGGPGSIATIGRPLRADLFRSRGMLEGPCLAQSFRSRRLGRGGWMLAEAIARSRDLSKW